MKHPGHTYGGFVPTISERGMRLQVAAGAEEGGVARLRRTACGGAPRKKHRVVESNRERCLVGENLSGEKYLKTGRGSSVASRCS
jgi:hypothetical protein